MTLCSHCLFCVSTVIYEEWMYIHIGIVTWQYSATVEVTQSIAEFCIGQMINSYIDAFSEY